MPVPTFTSAENLVNFVAVNFSFNLIAALKFDQEFPICQNRALELTLLFFVVPKFIEEYVSLIKIY